MGNGHALVEIALTQGLAGWLGGDGLDGLAMDRNLPAANALILAVVLLPDGQAPLFQQVHRGVYVASHVTAQLLAGQANHVIHPVPNKVFWRVPAIALAHVAVDSREALTSGTAAFDSRFFHHHYPQIPAPEFGLKGRAAAGHAAANDQDIA